MTTAFFFLFAGFVLAAALVVVLGRNLVHSAIALIFTFFGVAALYVLLDAEFLAAVQVLLYIGGITILLLFAIMLTSRLSPRGMEIFNEQVLPAALITGGILVALLYAAWQGIRPAGPPPAPLDSTTSLGTLFLTSHVLPFEVASVLLLVAMVGAILLARKDR
ncbi:MAG: NADH-quinone oxidoreductase subunit J [candidate division NC10 bacterium]|nr:NADH-quinone oxidoreductase subunit J [candidate division NC10 bacterium]